MAKRKVSKVRQQYDKEYRRVQRLIRANEDRGYLVEDILPERLIRPNKRSVANLQKINREYILNHAEAINPETGEIISARERNAIDRSYAAKRAAETRKARLNQNVSRETINMEVPATPVPKLPSYGEIVVGNFKAEMARMPGGNGDRIIGFINDIINREGIDSVAEMLEEANNAGKMPSYNFLASGQEEMVIEALGEMLDFLPDVSDTFKRDVIEEFEYHEGGY